MGQGAPVRLLALTRIGQYNKTHTSCALFTLGMKSDGWLTLNINAVAQIDR